MKSLVISLKTATERREHIERQFSQQQVQYEFFDALTPDLAAPLAEKMQLKVDEQFLSPGELACFMSHVSIWKKMVDENIPFLAVFEDDVYLGEQSALLLNSSDWISSEYDIIKTEAFAEKVFLGAAAADLPGDFRKLYPLKGKNLGTAGYILSLKGAQTYLSYVQKVQLIALDQLMFGDFIREGSVPVYQVSPALCIQEMMLYPEKSKTSMVSDLVTERKQRMKKYKKKGWAKVQVELERIVSQLKYMLFGKHVGFK